MKELNIRKTSLHEDWKGYLFILPAAAALILLILYPLVYGVVISFFDTNLLNKWDFVGFKYYLRVLSDSKFYKSIWITLIYTFFVVLGRLVCGTFLAILLNRKNLPGKIVFRSILVMPWFFPDVVIAILWKWMFNPTYGMINSILLKMGLIHGPVEWLSGMTSAFIVVILVSIWKGVAFVIIMVLAGLQTIPEELYESAELDGASSFQKFTYITIPSIQNILAITTLLSTMWSFKHFTIIWNMTYGGPIDATNVVSIDIYKTAFSYFRFGESATRAVIVFILIIVFALFFKKRLKED